MTRLSLIFYWAARIVAAIILLQTLFFKFTGAEESIFIFKTVHMEPWGRIGTGILELIASVLILISSTAWLGAGLALGLMAGAITMHLTLLGIQVQGDGGQLFIYALLVTFCSVFVLWVNKSTVLSFVKKIFRQ
jgi:hypothetical protein